jgi:hypothetical protein
MTQERKRNMMAFGLSFAIVLVPLVSFAADPGGLVPCEGSTCKFSDLVLLVNRVINFLLYVIAFPVSAGLFAWAGILYLTAAGDGGKVKKAHDIFQNVFWGLILALAGFLIVNFLTMTLTGTGWAANPFADPVSEGVSGGSH